MKPNISKKETIYTCPDKLVTIIRKNSRLSRWPKHDYMCYLYVLRPKPGTRIATKADGSCEFMPAYEDLVRMLVAIEPDLKKVLPKNLTNKPLGRKRRFDAINRRRHERRGGSK